MANKSNAELWEDVRAYREQVRVLTDQLLGIEELKARAERLQADLTEAGVKIANLKNELTKANRKRLVATQRARQDGFTEGRETGRKER